MDLIAGRKIDGIMTGSIEFDGSVNISKSNIAYVQVTDVHIGEFTVMENLYYAARFRLGNNISDAEVTSRCHAIATSVSLENVVDVCVGSELTKGISGGQKKRLSIAIELLALPAVLCLDEPTSGTRHGTTTGHLITSYYIHRTRLSYLVASCRNTALSGAVRQDYSLHCAPALGRYAGALA